MYDVLFSMCLCPDFPLLGTPVIEWGPSLVHYDLVLIWLHLQRSYFQIKSRSQVLGFRTSYLFGDTVNPQELLANQSCEEEHLLTNRTWWSQPHTQDNNNCRLWVSNSDANSKVFFSHITKQLTQLWSIKKLYSTGEVYVSQFGPSRHSVIWFSVMTLKKCLLRAPFCPPQSFCLPLRMAPLAFQDAPPGIFDALWVVCNTQCPLQALHTF